MANTKLIQSSPRLVLENCLGEFETALRNSPFNTYLIVPTSRLSAKVKEELTNQSEAAISTSVVTPEEFAEIVIESSLPDHRIIGNVEAMTILSSILGSGHDGRPRLLEDVPLSIGELSDVHLILSSVRSQLTEEQFRELGRNNENIHALSQVNDEYSCRISDEKLIDSSVLFRKAAECIRKKMVARTIFLAGIIHDSPGFHEMVKALREAPGTLVYCYPYAENPKVFPDGGEWVGADTTTENKNESGFDLLFSGERPINVPVSLFTQRFSTFRDEITSVAQEISEKITAGTKPENIAVAFPDVAGAIPLVAEIFSDFSIPFTSSATFSLSRSPLVQALCSLPDIPVLNYSRESVINAFSSPYLGLADNFGISTALIDRVAREAHIQEGYSSWERKLSNLKKRRESEITSPDTPDYKIKNLNKSLNDIQKISSTLLPFLKKLHDLEKKKTTDQHIAALKGLYLHLGIPVPSTSRHSAQDVYELRDFSELLDTLERANAFHRTSGISFSYFMRLLRHTVSQTRNLKSHRNQDAGVNVVGIRELQGASFAVLFICQLVEQAIPSIASLLPYLSEDEERIIWEGKVKDKLIDEKRLFISALSSAQEILYLSCADIVTGEPSVPSPFFMEVCKSAAHSPWEKKVPTNSARYRSYLAGKSLKEGKTVLSSYLPASIDCNNLVRQINAEGFYRQGPYSSTYDGILRDESDIVSELNRRFGEKHPFSVSALERYATCPFRFYLQDVLKIDAPQEVEIVLSNRERGTAMHAILANFYRMWMDGHSALPSPKEHEEACSSLFSIAGNELDTYNFEGPAWDAFKDEFFGCEAIGAGLLERFLLEEESKHDGVPLIPFQFEYGFGFPGVAHTLSSEPVPIPVPDSDDNILYLRGFIDRVDTGPGDIFAITDYKSGLNHPKKADISKGTSFQIPLYIRAYEILSGKQGVAGGYYVVNRKEVLHQAELFQSGNPYVKDSFTKLSRGKETDLNETVDISVKMAWDCIELLRSGYFPLSSDSKQCSDYCDFKYICRFSSLRLCQISEEGD